MDIYSLLQRNKKKKARAPRCMLVVLVIILCSNLCLMAQSQELIHIYALCDEKHDKVDLEKASGSAGFTVTCTYTFDPIVHDVPHRIRINLEDESAKDAAENAKENPDDPPIQHLYMNALTDTVDVVENQNTQTVILNFPCLNESEKKSANGDWYIFKFKVEAQYTGATSDVDSNEVQIKIKVTDEYKNTCTNPNGEDCSSALSSTQNDLQYDVDEYTSNTEMILDPRIVSKSTFHCPFTVTCVSSPSDTFDLCDSFDPLNPTVTRQHNYFQSYASSTPESYSVTFTATTTDSTQTLTKTFTVVLSSPIDCSTQTIMAPATAPFSDQTYLLSSTKTLTWTDLNDLATFEDPQCASEYTVAFYRYSFESSTNAYTIMNQDLPLADYPYSIDLEKKTFDIQYDGTLILGSFSLVGITHEIGYKILHNSASLSDTPSYFNNIAFDVTFTDTDPCLSATIALKSNAVQSYTYEYSTETYASIQDHKLFDISTMVTTVPAGCPLPALTYTCAEWKYPVGCTGVAPDCQTEGNCITTQANSAFNFNGGADGVFNLWALETASNIFVKNTQQIKFTATTADNSQTIDIPIEINFVSPQCQYNEDQFIWKENADKAGVEATKNVVHTFEDVHRDYLGSNDVPIYSLINPFKTDDGSLIYEEFASNDCAVQPQRWFRRVYVRVEGEGGIGTSIDQGMIDNDKMPDAMDVDYARPDSLDKTFNIRYRLSDHGDAQAFVGTSADYPTYDLHYLQVDGYMRLELDRFTQDKLIVDLKDGPVTIRFTPPAFKDEVGNDNIDLLDVSKPLRKVQIQVVGNESSAITDFLASANVTTVALNIVEYTFESHPLNAVSTLEIKTCYSYGDYENLKDLCDLENTHTITNAEGICIKQFSPTVDQAKRQVIELETYEYTVGTQPEVAELFALADVVTSKISNPICPTDLLFRFSDQTLEKGLDTILELTPAGKLSWLPTVNETWAGFHELTFVAYDEFFDPDGTLKLVEIELVASIEVKLPSEEKATDTFSREKPILNGDTIPAIYLIPTDQVTLLTLNFADPLAISIENGDTDASTVTLDGLEVKIQSSDLLTSLTISKVDYESGGVGFATLYLEIDGAIAVTEIAKEDSTTEAEPQTETEQDAAAVEEKQEAQQATAKVTLLVTDTSEGGLSSTFELVFAIDDGQQDEVETEDDAEEDENIALAKVQAQQQVRMEQLFTEAFNTEQSEDETIEEVEIEASLESINESGQVFISFSPSIAIVPTNWLKLWDQEEREQLSLKDLEAYEKELLKIMHIEMIKNSEEPDQRYMMTNLTEFTSGGLTINLNFSDPLFISQGETFDFVKIKLLKSYFMRPSKLLAQNKGLTQSTRRNLQDYEDDGEYLIITQSLPKQLADKGDLQKLQGAGDAAASILQTGFLLTFLLQLALKGVMGQLWNVFNTLQIIMALPLMAVLMPANVLFVKQVLDMIINFQPIPTATLYEYIGEPIFGKAKNNNETIGAIDESDPNSEPLDEPEEEKSSNYVMKVLFLVCSLIAFALLIGLILLCKKVIEPRCPCCKKIIHIIQSKIMFNSIMRALMQTYLITCISMWTAISMMSFSSGTEITNSLSSLATLVAAIAFPVFVYRLLTKKEAELPTPTFKAKFDSLYQNMDLYKKQAYGNTSLFLLRRLLFAFVIVICSPSIVLQVAAADILSTLLLVFYVTVVPMTDGLNNFIQIFNELVVLISIQLLFIYTNYVESPVIRYDLAWYFLYLMGFNCAVNVLIMFVVVGKKVYMAVRKWYVNRTSYKEKQKVKAAKSAIKEGTLAVENDQGTRNRRHLPIDYLLFIQRQQAQSSTNVERPLQKRNMDMSIVEEQNHESSSSVSVSGSSQSKSESELGSNSSSSQSQSQSQSESGSQSQSESSSQKHDSSRKGQDKFIEFNAPIRKQIAATALPPIDGSYMGRLRIGSHLNEDDEAMIQEISQQEISQIDHYNPKSQSYLQSTNLVASDQQIRESAIDDDWMRFAGQEEMHPHPQFNNQMMPPTPIPANTVFHYDYNLKKIIATYPNQPPQVYDHHQQQQQSQLYQQEQYQQQQFQQYQQEQYQQQQFQQYQQPAFQQALQPAMQPASHSSFQPTMHQELLHAQQTGLYINYITPRAPPIDSNMIQAPESPKSSQSLGTLINRCMGTEHIQQLAKRSGVHQTQKDAYHQTLTTIMGGEAKPDLNEVGNSGKKKQPGNYVEESSSDSDITVSSRPKIPQLFPPSSSEQSASSSSRQSESQSASSQSESSSEQSQSKESGESSNVSEVVSGTVSQISSETFSRIESVTISVTDSSSEAASSHQSEVSKSNELSQSDSSSIVEPSFSSSQSSDHPWPKVSKIQ